MTPGQFNLIMHELLDKCVNTLNQKSNEYADTGDRLSNFKKAARIAGITPEQALMGFRLKHETALMDFVQWISAGRIVPFMNVEEKIVDLIAYNILLYSLISERYTPDEKLHEKTE